MYKIDKQQDDIELEPDEVDDVIHTWGYTLVACVKGGFSGRDAIKKLANPWRVPYTYIQKCGWLVFRFEKSR